MTVAAYAVVASLLNSRAAAICVGIAVLLTALSRVHMGAHTPLQVTCGCVAGLATALAVRASDKVVCVCVWVCVCIYMYVYIDKHTYIHTSIYRFLP